MWSIEHDPGTRLLTMRLVLLVPAPQMRSLSRAHAQALLATGGEPFGVLADLRGLSPLDAEAAALLAEMRRAASAQPGFRGRAVVADSATVAMQQRRAAIEDEIPGGRELITMDESEAKVFLQACTQ